jgi:urate oxidase
MSGGFEYTISYGKQGVPVYRVFATPLRNVAPIPESALTGRDNNLLACEIDVEVFGDEFLPPTPRATTRWSSPPTA